MNCVTVSNFFPGHHGGLEIVVGELMHRLAASGIRITWFASMPAPSTNPSVPDMTYHGMVAWNFLEEKTGLPMPLWSMNSWLVMWRVMASADIVFLNDCIYVSSVIAWVMAKARGKKIVILQHIDEIPFKSRLLSWSMRCAYAFASRTVLARADRVVFCSHKVEAWFARRAPWLKRVALISNGVDSRVFTPDERQTLAPRPRILFVGRFVERKGLAILHELARQFPGCDWIFAGYGVADPAAWGLANVQVRGRIDRQDMPRLYGDCDLLVLPSVGEGFPLVVQEAISCGLPVLVSAETASGYPAAASLLMIAELSVPGFAAAIRSFLQRRHAELEPSLRKRRHEFAVAHWSWDAAACKYIELFDELMASQLHQGAGQ